MLKLSNFSKEIIILTTLSIILFLILDSRALLIGNMVAILFLLYKEKIKIGKYLLFALPIFFSLSFLYKSDSTYGRLFIYKICNRILEENWMLGLGKDSFKKYYLLEQARYFQVDLYQKRELLLADNTIFAFNDYFQLFCEYGLSGLMIVTLFFYAIIKTINYHYEYDKYTKVSIFIIISLIVSAFFSHMYEKNIVKYLVVILLFYNFSLISLRNRKTIISLTLIVTILTLKEVHKSWYENRILTKVAKAIKTGDYRLADHALMGLYKDKKCREDCLLYLGKVNYILRNYDKSVTFLNSYLTVKSNSYVYSLLGDAYYKLNKYEKSEASYLTAIYMVPNRFEERFKLFELYLFKKRLTDAVRTGNEILNLPIKVPTLRINYIKAQVLTKINYKQL